MPSDCALDYQMSVMQWLSGITAQSLISLNHTGADVLLSGCSINSIKSLQLIQNAAARTLTRTKKYEHISPVLASLHWLPVKSRIDFRTMMRKFSF